MLVHWERAQTKQQCVFVVEVHMLQALFLFFVHLCCLEGHSELCSVDGALVMHMKEFKEITVDSENMLVTFGPGAKLGEILTATGKHGTNLMFISKNLVVLVAYKAVQSQLGFALQLAWVGITVLYFSFLTSSQV